MISERHFPLQRSATKVSEARPLVARGALPNGRASDTILCAPLKTSGASGLKRELARLNHVSQRFKGLFDIPLLFSCVAVAFGIRSKLFEVLNLVRKVRLHDYIDIQID